MHSAHAYLHAFITLFLQSISGHAVCVFCLKMATEQLARLTRSSDILLVAVKINMVDRR